MRVLVAGTDERSIQLAEDRLRDHGVATVCCHVPGARAFPCLGLSGLASCPLSRPVDAVITVRSHPLPQPARREIGVTCALRDGVPLIVAGRTALQPFEGLTEAVVDGTDPLDLVRACEDVRGVVRLP